MRFAVLVFLIACGTNEPKQQTPPPPATPAPMPTAAGIDAAVPVAPPPADAAQAKVEDPAPPDGYDFTPVARELLAVGACEGTPPEEVPAELVKSHCAVIEKAQQEYVDGWVKQARAWFAEKVPAGLPKKVVYPFAGGDLSTALVVFPDAEEITTVSLEPAGDPRTLEVLTHPKAVGKKAAPKPGPTLAKALKTIEVELDRLYRVNFSNTLQMIDAMRGGALPTQLVFGLSALKVEGYEVVSLRYFKLANDGAIQYLTEADVKKAPAVGDDNNTANASFRNRVFANAEIRFRKPGGPIQTYRHIQFNLDEEHMKKDTRLVKHLEAKGEVSGMTKAASYLMSFDNFKTIRDYMMKHVVWMVSDATGVAPRWGKPAGFEYETYGEFSGPHIPAGKSISKDWEAEWKAEPKRPLAFRFGYYDAKTANHLVIMRKKPQ